MAKAAVGSKVNAAVMEGDIPQLMQLLDSGESIEELSPITGFRPLHTAAAAGSTQMAEVLLERGAKIDALSDPEHPAPFAKCTPLIVAAGKGHYEVVELLVARGADVNANLSSKHVSTALTWGARSGDRRIVDLLLQAGAIVEPVALFGPVWNADVELVALLLERGADANAVDGDDKPLIVRACEKPIRDANVSAQIEIVRLLVRAGANLEARNDLGATALIAAAQAKNQKLALELLSLGSDVRAGDYGNMTALHSAATDGDLVLAEALLKAGADAQRENTFKETPLTRAKESKNKDMVALLTAH